MCAVLLTSAHAIPTLSASTERVLLQLCGQPRTAGPPHLAPHLAERGRAAALHARLWKVWPSAPGATGKVVLIHSLTIACPANRRSVSLPLGSMPSSALRVARLSLKKGSRGARSRRHSLPSGLPRSRLHRPGWLRRWAVLRKHSQPTRQRHNAFCTCI